MQVLEDKLDGSTISNLKYEDDGIVLKITIFTKITIIIMLDNSEKATFKIYLT